jgi:hypothetical protein
MADFDPAQDAGGTDSIPGDRKAGVGTAVNAVGALASIALIVGIGVWGYKLVMRDVSGVPVVRAVEGPMRLQPENPGGRPADHQGLAVNAVAAQGTAEEPAERLVLAPRPVDLLDEDKPMAGDAPAVVLSREEQPEPDAPGAKVTAADEVATDESPDVSVQALVNQLIAEVMPNEAAAMDASPDGPKVVPAVVRKVETAADAEEETMAESHANPLDSAENDAEIILAAVSGLRIETSVRPQSRPATGMTVSRAALVEPTDADLDVAPEDVPAGTRMAQLGAFESAEVALQEWGRLSRQFGDYLNGKQRVIQKASSGGRTFYRLRAMGFEDLSDARRFCSALVAERADCIPVVHR